MSLYVIFSKLMYMSNELMLEFSHVSECFKRGNILVFFQDMAHNLSDLQFTRGMWTDWRCYLLKRIKVPLFSVMFYAFLISITDTSVFLYSNTRLMLPHHTVALWCWTYADQILQVLRIVACA